MPPLEHVFFPYTQIIQIEPPVTYDVGYRRLIKNNRFWLRISNRFTFIENKIYELDYVYIRPVCYISLSTLLHVRGIQLTMNSNEF